MATEGRSRTRCFTTSELQRSYKWHLHFVVHKEGHWGIGLCAKWPGSHRASSKPPAQWGSSLALGMDEILFHHSQACLLFAIHKIFSNPSLEKKYPKPVLFSNAIRTELIAEEHAILLEHFSIHCILHSGTETVKHMEGAQEMVTDDN